jgi:hypothetical protein
MVGVAFWLGSIVCMSALRLNRRAKMSPHFYIPHLCHDLMTVHSWLSHLSYSEVEGSWMVWWDILRVMYVS